MMLSAKVSIACPSTAVHAAMMRLHGRHLVSIFSVYMKGNRRIVLLSHLAYWWYAVLLQSKCRLAQSSRGLTNNRFSI